MEKSATIVKRIKPVKIETPRRKIIHSLLNYSRSLIIIQKSDMNFIYQNN